MDVVHEMSEHLHPSLSGQDGIKITVLIPNWNGIRWLGECLKSLSEQDLQGFRIVIIDNGSTDHSVRFVRENYPAVDVIEIPTNTGFANAVNVGIEKALTPYIVLLNSDTCAYPDWLRNLLDEIESSPSDVAAINSLILRLENPDLVDDAGDELSWYGAATKRGHNEPATGYQVRSEIFSPCAAATLYRRDFLLRTGGFDRSFFAYLEDVDLGLRGRLLGYRYLYTPKARVLHKGHGAGLRHRAYVEMITRNRLLLFAKNIPGRLLLRHAAKLIYGQLYFFIIYAHPWSSLNGLVSFLAMLPTVISVRRETLRRSMLSYHQIESLLDTCAPQPPLRALFGKYLRRLTDR